MNEQNNLSWLLPVVVPIAALVGVGGLAGASSSYVPSLQSNTIINDAGESEEDKTVMQHIKTVQSFENQKIKRVGNGEIELASGQIIKTDGAEIPCKVGDKIMNYDTAKESFRCEEEYKSGYKRSHYIRFPINRNKDFQTAHTYLMSNGYSFNPTTNRYNHSSGAQYAVGDDASSGAKSVSKTSSKSSSSGSSSSGKSGRGGVGGSKGSGSS
jgi:hypothetical protein